MDSMEEIEVKFLDINVGDIEDKLKGLGATKVFDFLYKRRVFDHKDKSLESNNSWLRLRDEGDKVTLTYKRRFGVGEDRLKDEGMHEVEINVNDFDKTAQLIQSIGMVEKFYEENRRIKYILDGVEFCIDTWPLIPTYLEIEGATWDAVKKAAQDLNLNWDDHIKCSTMQIYEHYGMDENDYSVLTFESQTKK